MSMLHAMRHGAYWCSNGYDVLAVNARGAANWPWMRAPGANVMISLLTGEGREQCVDWEHRWAPLLLAQLRREIIHQQGSGQLEVLVRRVCRDPLARRIWEGTADVQPRAYGTTRPMIMPPWGAEPVEITVSAVTPVVRPDLRMVCAVPAPGVTPFPALSRDPRPGRGSGSAPRPGRGPSR
ncbi:hypothetical protein VSR01_28475 [Actinacidiphila sp. DG2A-62]|uniref:MmyB family transcriptional regulator n=1 Tax=Actinacidiphila sp. DG2A-62 TaxID=3108821 RepID=UPI002DB88928|nr:hypothetical protein [Actinacidiphila sp. DG2A-62]MEC3997227.1 hypothetical protein [Actinacidiphila sp. DG2A-62]